MARGTAIKATLADGSSPVHALAWDLPTANADGTWTPGAWQRVGPGPVRYRGHGIHVCGSAEVAYWTRHLRGRRLVAWVCEYQGQVARGPHGLAARAVRLLRPWTGEDVEA